MDSKEALDCTLELLEVYDIYNISSKNKQIDAENPFVIYVNNQRYMILMRTFISLIIIVFSRYAIINESSIACLNPFIYERMSIAKEKMKQPKSSLLFIEE